MKLMVDVVRVEQSWDVDANKQESGIVVRLVSGVELRIPCSETQLAEIVSKLANTKLRAIPEEPEPPSRIFTYSGGEVDAKGNRLPPSALDAPVELPVVDEPLEHGGVFQAVEEPTQVPRLVVPKAALAPVSRPRQVPPDEAGFVAG